MTTQEAQFLPLGALIHLIPYKEQPDNIWIMVSKTLWLRVDDIQSLKHHEFQREDVYGYDPYAGLFFGRGSFKGRPIKRIA